MIYKQNIHLYLQQIWSGKLIIDQIKKKGRERQFFFKLPVCHWNMIHVHLDQSSAQQNINSGHGNIECYPCFSAQACHALFALFRASPQRSTSLLALRNSSPERWQGSRNQSQQNYMSQKTVITFIMGVQMLKQLYEDRVNKETHLLRMQNH